MIALNDDSFDVTVSQISPVLVMFYADWAGPCHLATPVFEKLAGRYGNATIFAKVDIDESVNTPYMYGVRSVPCFILFEDGKPTMMKAGAVPEEVLEEMCNA